AAEPLRVVMKQYRGSSIEGRVRAALPRSPLVPRRSSLEFQSTFTRRIRQRRNAAVVAETGTIERNLLDAGGLRLFGDRLADSRSGGLVFRALQILRQVLMHRRCRGQHLAAVGRNDLGVDVLI